MFNPYMAGAHFHALDVNTTKFAFIISFSASSQATAIFMTL
jgi:hypothetical protein